AAAGAHEGRAVTRAGAAGAPDGLVADEGGVADSRRAEDNHAPAQTLAAGESAGHAGAEGLVADEGRAGDGHFAVNGGSAAVAAGVSAIAAGSANRLVVREVAVGDGETSVVVDRAPFRRPVARTEALELHERIRSAVHRAGGPIADERRVADGGGAAAGRPCLVPEGPADYQRVVVEKDIAVQANGGADLAQDAAAALLRTIHCALGAA